MEEQTPTLDPEHPESDENAQKRHAAMEKERRFLGVRHEQTPASAPEQSE